MIGSTRKRPNLRLFGLCLAYYLLGFIHGLELSCCEILTPADIVVLFDEDLITVSFSASHSKKRFILSLRRDAAILHPDAVVEVVAGDNVGGRTTITPVNQTNIFSGTANDDPKQRVSATEVDGVWIIHIRSASSLVSVEPMRWYDPSANTSTMVVYEGWQTFSALQNLRRNGRKVSDKYQHNLDRPRASGEDSTTTTDWRQTVGTSQGFTVTSTITSDQNTSERATESLVNQEENPNHTFSDITAETVHALESSPHRNEANSSTDNVKTNSTSWSGNISTSFTIKNRIAKRSQNNDPRHVTDYLYIRRAENNSNENYRQDKTDSIFDAENNESETSGRKNHGAGGMIILRDYPYNGSLPDKQYVNRAKSRRKKRTNLRKSNSINTNNKNNNNNNNNYHHNNGNDGATECDILAIVDFTMFSHLGSDVKLAVAALTIVYQYVDAILRRTRFGSEASGCGIVVKKFRVYTSYTRQNPESHFNDESPTPVKASFLLDVLRTSSDSGEFYHFCLVHLNCYRDFRPTVVGMSYLAETDEDVWSAGICGVYHDKTSTPSPSNVFLSTVSSYGKLGIDLIEYALVVTHELGHSWGSQHDPDFDDHRQCRGHGQLVMNSLNLAKFVVQEAEFSPCSVQEIAALLRIRRKKCFLDKSLDPPWFRPNLGYEPTCGDGKVDGDAGEDCDPGFGHLRNDPCCTSWCTLMNDSACALSKDPCCTARCQIAPAGYQCNAPERPARTTPRQQQDRSDSAQKQQQHQHQHQQHQLLLDLGIELELDTSCYKLGLDEKTSGICTGEDARVCLPITASRMPDGSPCGEFGECNDGRCVSECEKLGLTEVPPRHLLPCPCGGSNIECLFCCRSNSSSCDTSHARAGSFVNEKMTLHRRPDGSRCGQGVCISGTCHRNDTAGPDNPQAVDQLARDKDSGQWSLLEWLSPSNAKGQASRGHSVKLLLLLWWCWWWNLTVPSLVLGNP